VGEHIDVWERAEMCTGLGNLRQRPLGRPRHRWEDNNIMDLQEVGCEGIVWIDLGQDKGRWQHL